jgi:hypothetical protein
MLPIPDGKMSVSHWERIPLEVVSAALVYRKRRVTTERLTIYGFKIPISQWEVKLHKVVPSALVHSKGSRTSETLLFFFSSSRKSGSGKQKGTGEELMRFYNPTSEGVREPSSNMTEIDVEEIKQRNSQCFEEDGNDNEI